MTNCCLRSTARKITVRVSLLVAAIALSILAACSKPEAPDSGLPSLAASGGITVSGISSGGYMAGQFLVAYSAEVSGAAIVAAGPWGCAQGEITRALQTCISGEGLEVDDLQTHAGEMAASGEIDALAGLADSSLFIFHGANDTVIGDATVDGLQDWFSTYLDEKRIARVDDIDVVHGWPTLNFGAPCDTFVAPYINNCGYDIAGNLLAHLYGELNPPLETGGNLRSFDQGTYGGAGLAENGYAYIPADCEQNDDCRVHVFFHGCEQSAETVGTTLVENSGLNRWADSNRIIVLYPQAVPSLAAPMNPLGCWDWWGYTGQDYLSKTGSQLSAVRRMVATLQTR